MTEVTAAYLVSCVSRWTFRRGPFVAEVALGSSALFEGLMYLATRSDSGTENWIAGLLSALAGVLLLVGFLTPVVAVVVGGLELVNALGAVPSTALLVAGGALPGPGAFSADARCFGLRESSFLRASR